jgi:PIN domain nuclease of toxin-antitoxin system
MLFDTSAVLAYVNAEPGWQDIEPLLLSGKARISTVNQTEVISKLCDWGMDAQAANTVFDQLALQLEPFTDTHAREAARIRPITRNLGLSLGDRACLATARNLQLTVITGDRPWLQLADALALSIRNIRPETH